MKNFLPRYRERIVILLFLISTITGIVTLFTIFCNLEEIADGSCAISCISFFLTLIMAIDEDQERREK